MKSRLIASIALGAAVVLGATGCSMISPQATTIQYSPADGINVKNNGAPLEIRNALVVADEDGSRGNLVAAIVNTTNEGHTLNIQLGEGDTAVSKTVRVAANSVVSLGDETTAPLLLKDLNALPGSTVPLYFQSGDAEGALVSVPVLSGTLDYLRHLAPRD